MNGHDQRIYRTMAEHLDQYERGVIRLDHLIPSLNNLSTTVYDAVGNVVNLIGPVGCTRRTNRTPVSPNGASVMGFSGWDELPMHPKVSRRQVLAGLLAGWFGLARGRPQTRTPRDRAPVRWCDHPGTATTLIYESPPDLRAKGPPPPSPMILTYSNLRPLA
jgi:hypothetical protein